MTRTDIYNAIDAERVRQAELCGCGHRAWTEDQHTTHTQGDPA